MVPSVEYFKRLGSCWPIERLQEVWDAANAPASPTWTWFLGARLKGYARADVVLRVQLAVAHVLAARVPFPHATPAACTRFVKYCPDEQIVPLCELLGHYLDNTDDDNAREVLGTLLSDSMPAKPQKA